MKILHVVNSLDSGGAQTLIEALATAKGESDLYIVVLLGRGDLSSRIESFGQVTHLNLSKSVFSVFSGIVRLWRLVWSVKPDIIHSHLQQSDLLVALVRAPKATVKIRTVHTTGFVRDDGIQAILLQALLPFLQNSFKVHVACTSATSKYLVEKGFRETQILTISNSTALPPMPKVFWPNSPVILSLARYHPMKDFNNLLDAFRLVRERVSNAELHLLGTGTDKSNRELESQIAFLGLGDSVRCFGPLADIRRFLQESTCLVISSAYGEALPMSGLEAMSQGLPVVTTDVGDCAVLASFPWQVVPPGNSEKLADALLHCLTMNKKQRQELSEHTLETFKSEFSKQKTIGKYFELYGTLIRANKNTSLN